MHSPRVYFDNIGSICTDSLRHGNGLSALLLLTRAAKSSAAKTRSMESGLYTKRFLSACRRVKRLEIAILNPLSMERVFAVLLLPRLLIIAAQIIRFHDADCLCIGPMLLKYTRYQDKARFPWSGFLPR